MNRTSTRFTFGFTLIEILVVMVIIAIASAIIVVKVGSFYLSNKRSEVFVQEMATFIELARNQAIFSMNTIGLKISSKDYVFLKLDDTNGTQWKSMGENDPFWAKHSIPDNVLVSYKIESTSQHDNARPASFSPQIIVLPSGEMTPFVISIHNLGSTKVYTIKGTNTGQTSLGTQ